MGELIGKVVLIAGALGATGVGLAEDFRAKGATVLIAPGGSLAPDLVARATGLEVIAGAGGDPADLARRCDEIVVRHGGLDLVVFCSGSNLPQHAADRPAFDPPAKTRRLLRRWGARLMGFV